MTPVIRHLLPLLLLASTAGMAAEGAQPEAALKAAFVYNFALFTHWPQPLAAGEPFYFCVPDDEAALTQAVVALAGKKLNAHDVVAIVPESVQEAARCRVWLAAASHTVSPPSGALTVVDGYGALSAAITLEIEDEHVRFDVDTRELRSSGLTLSSKLLRLARRVR